MKEEEESNSAGQEQPGEKSSSHILYEGDDDVQQTEEIEAECIETVEAESSLVPSAEFAEDVGEPSFTHNANHSVIESAATNETSEEGESFVPETQFDTTNDFEMKSNDSIQFKNGNFEYNDSVLLPNIQNGSYANHEMGLIQQTICTDTSDKMENEVMASEGFDSDIVYEKQAGTYEDVEHENLPIELTEAENGAAIEKGK